MSYLLDTVVISETSKRRPEARVLAWLAAQAVDELFLSVLTFGEIRKGILAKDRSDPAGAARLQRWADELRQRTADRVLPIDELVAFHWAPLVLKTGQESTDLLIAATALRHGLTLATRNVRHFQGIGVPIVNPWDQA